MKFVLAPDKFKGSLTGLEFCQAAEKGLKSVYPEAEVQWLPMADGGDGTIEVVRFYLEGNIITVRVHNPLFRDVEAHYIFSEKQQLAYIEMAEASGIKVLNQEAFNCLHTTSLGTGELILDAINRGAKEIILGIGGSATNDAGMGMATALGYRFLDHYGSELEPVGAQLQQLAKIDTATADPRLEKVTFITACDVKNPLYGKDGAAYVYGPQKGASNVEVDLLDAGLRNFAAVVRNDIGINLQEIEGAGAAGGLGAGAVLFLKSSLTSGVDLIKRIADFDNKIDGANWIITGEGKLDGQTLSGKTIDGILRSGREKGIPVAAICGAIELKEDALKELGFRYAAAVSGKMPNQELAFKHASENVMLAAQAFALQLE